MWWNNSNSVLISHYYLDVVEWTGGPLLTQSDLGNENGHLAQAHTFLRHTHDPALIGMVGIDEGWYNLKLQAKLDVYVLENNNTKKYHNRKIARPNGVPLLIEQAPECFGTQDFKVAFTSESITAAQAIYALPDHPVLKLVPHLFAVLAYEYLKQLGHSIINRHSIWNMYLALVGMFWANNILTPEE
ncbi:hypothetical protein ARMGADRAFT_1038433 [Armillaria gallica]|uniref:Uncharacterized protein n=1 Tax=Armillaria gallica TaxID=47427 RepID=A0A2H3CL80_ARMGA|nr:hypothetical protein ARMGADRAFT_1038433 [Armillaria gallica]